MIHFHVSYCAAPHENGRFTLHGVSRAKGTTVFVDPGTWQPYPDQFAHLSHTARLSPDEVEVLVTGLGKTAAAVATTRALSGRDLAGLTVVNLSTAGALRDGLEGLHEVGTVVSVMQQEHLEVRDVESLREHYALTLRHWVSNLEAECDRAESIVGGSLAPELETTAV